MSELVNLTPHRLTILGEDGEEVLTEIEPSGDVARVDTERVQAGSVNGIPVYKTEMGEVTGLPAPSSDTIYVVSGYVRQAVPERDDVVSPGELVRDEDGNPVGAKGLTR